MITHEHKYTLQLAWIGEIGLNSVNNDRQYEVKIPGKATFKGSADKAFHGDETLINPEDMMMTAISSCHMMSYFYLCRKNNIEIISYCDNPIGLLGVNVDGSGQFNLVTLKPSVKLGENTNLEFANNLHEKASKLCFIANSCNFRIVIEAEMSV